MEFLTLLGIFNDSLVLIFGLLLSVGIAGGWKNRGQKRLTVLLGVLFLLIQGICWGVLGESMARKLYPLIVHLPLILVLVLALRRRIDITLVSVCTAYLCCQMPRWIKLLVTDITKSPLAGEVGYTLFILPLFYLLWRYFVRPAHDAITYSSQSLLLFGSLPVAYYLFDYATSVYSDVLHGGAQVLNEFLPTALIVFYVIFVAAYHTQIQRRMQAEVQQSMLEAELKQYGLEMELLWHTSTQIAVYQHDMRHQMIVLEGLLAAGKAEQAEEYIKKIQADLECITPRRFCENEIVNMLCSSFERKAERLGVALTVKATLPSTLSVSDTELCSVLSNGLENALHAVSGLYGQEKWVKFYCEIRMNKLLIEIKNPYTGEIVLDDGIPVSERVGHGYGCRSILAITQQHRGLCSFEPENGIFTLRVVLPA